MTRKTVSQQLGPALNEMIQNMEDISYKDRELQKALGKMIKPVATTAAKLAPPPGYPGDKPGLRALNTTLIEKTRTVRPGVHWWGMVGPKWPEGAHGNMVEGGTAPHAVNHPGSPAEPFVLPAYKKHVRQIIAAIGKELGEQTGEQLEVRARG